MHAYGFRAWLLVVRLIITPDDTLLSVSQCLAPRVVSRHLIRGADVVKSDGRQLFFDRIQF